MHPTIDEKTNDPAGPFKALRDAINTDLHVSMPGIIESFNYDTQTASIRLAIRRKLLKSTGTDNLDMPVLLDVPVFFPGGATNALTFPVYPGDECLVVFADSCIDAWYQSGGVQNQIMVRHHDYSDAFAFVGFRSAQKALQDIDQTHTMLIGASDTASQVQSNLDAHTGSKTNPHCVNASQVGVSNRNLLDNWDFRNPVNQRGQTAYSARGYTIDRWFIPGDSANVNVCNGYINCIATSNNYVADQFVDRNLIEDGAKYTISILFDDGVLLTATGSSAAEFYTPAYNGWLAGIQVYSTTAIFYIACRDLNVPANIAAVMLEKGTVSTLASAPAMDRFDTLQRCKQYYQRFRIGGAANNNYLGGMWLLPVEMHATTATLTLSTILTSNGAVTITQGGIFLYEGKAIKADCLVSANAGYYFEAEVILECD